MNKSTLTRLLDITEQDHVVTGERIYDLETEWLATTTPAHPTFARGFHMGTNLWIELCIALGRQGDGYNMDVPDWLPMPSDISEIALSDVMDAWDLIAIRYLRQPVIDQQLVRVHMGLRARTGYFLSNAATSEIMDQPASVTLYRAEREDEHEGASKRERPSLTNLYTISQSTVAAIEIYDRYITRWQRMALAYTEENCEPASLATLPRIMPNQCALRLFRAALGTLNKAQWTDRVRETIRRIRTAVLYRVCGLKRIVQYATHSQGDELSFTSMEERMTKLFKSAYRDALIVPGAAEWWNSMNPVQKSKPTDAVRRQHPDFDAEVKTHLGSIGVDLCLLQSRTSAGPVPWAQSVACTELLFQCIGSYRQDEDECIGAAILWGEYVVPYTQFFERREELTRMTNKPMLLCGPGGIKCLWNGAIQTPPDPNDPWGPVGVWFGLVRKHDPGCKGIERDADCTLATGEIQLAPFIKDAGPIWGD